MLGFSKKHLPGPTTSIVASLDLVPSVRYDHADNKRSLISVAREVSSGCARGHVRLKETKKPTVLRPRLDLAANRQVIDDRIEPEKRETTTGRESI